MMAFSFAVPLAAQGVARLEVLLVEMERSPKDINSPTNGCVVSCMLASIVVNYVNFAGGDIKEEGCRSFPAIQRHHQEIKELRDGANSGGDVGHSGPE